MVSFRLIIYAFDRHGKEGEMSLAALHRISGAHIIGGESQHSIGIVGVERHENIGIFYNIKTIVESVAVIQASA